MMSHWTCTTCTYSGNIIGTYVCQICETRRNVFVNDKTRLNKPSHLTSSSDEIILLDEDETSIKGRNLSDAFQRDKNGNAQCSDSHGTSKKQRVFIDLTNDEDEQDPRKTSSRMVSDRAQSRPQLVSTTSLSFPQNKIANTIQPTYLDGCVRLTPLPGHVDPQTRIFISQILQGQYLERAFFSTFVLEEEWLFSMIPNHVNVCLATQKSPDIPANENVWLASQTRCFVFPPMPNKYGCMHIKMMLLWYPGFVRFVLPSSNLISIDWAEIENVVFVQDFLKVTSTASSQSPPSKDNGFLDYLKQLLTTMHVPKTVIDRLDGYDYSRAAGKLVASIPGFHEESLTKGPRFGVGHVYLSKQVSSLFGDAQWLQRANATFLTSSLGNVSQKWLDEILHSVRGNHQGKLPASTSTPTSSDRDRTAVKIIYPTENTVRRSRLHQLNAVCSLFFDRKNWNRPTFPKHVIHEFESRSIGELSHTKMIMVCPAEHMGTRDSLENDHASFQDGFSLVNMNADQSLLDSCRGFVYCGSHNATASAWGDITSKKTATQKRATTAPIKLRISNWELGIIFPAYFGPTGEVKGQGRPLSDELYAKQLARYEQLKGNIVPSMKQLPVHFPPKPYGTNDKPWSVTFS